MRILALDASTEALSVALLDAERDVAREHFEIAPRAHASRLLPEAQRLLAEAGWTLGMLDGLAFGRGPGAFTGLRIAAGLIQGLASGLERPVAPVSTLAALAARCLGQARVERVRVVQDARMGEVYTADFARGTPPVLLGAERVVAPAAIDLIDDDNGWAAAGNGWALVADAGDGRSVSVAEPWPHALDIARLGAELLGAGQGVSAVQALPVYVRDDVARKPTPRSDFAQPEDR
ncbi:tRNA (adenosine(37)-N6)-threonylcarbamoyltransferase complex dimerization subunit type 1 TsaB [Salinisphaera sp. T31B1]|uniref:tRNA (adenosine(37)-N6)-threonylcarbamoyltransferase complex dimerization subunit type 1 TsaB n=1 Tax=Salinisphaera sp. T31B1 TaxID=727963 RepID=UPI00334061D8